VSVETRKTRRCIPLEGNMEVREIATRVHRAEDGIWYSKLRSSISYPESGNETYFEFEDTSFWFNHRNRCIVKLLKCFPPNGLFFDIGGGNGCVSRAIQDAGWPVALLEPGIHGAKNARLRGLETIISSTFEDAGFLEATIPAAGIFDVLEHVPDDLEFLQLLARSLRKDGRLYLTVPTLPGLWSAEDDEAGHYRRYTSGKLRRVIRQAGLELDYLTYFFTALPIPIFLLRSLPYRLGCSREPTRVAQRNRTEHTAPNGPLNAALQAILNRELLNIGAGRTMVVGSSCIAAARKA
jgi:SAM-dependent methyltransferase